MNVRAKEGPRFLLTPEWWLKEQDPVGPTWGPVRLSRAFEPGSLVPVTKEHPPPGWAPQLCH